MITLEAHLSADSHNSYIENKQLLFDIEDDLMTMAHCDEPDKKLCIKLGIFKRAQAILFEGRDVVLSIPLHESSSWEGVGEGPIKLAANANAFRIELPPFRRSVMGVAEPDRVLAMDKVTLVNLKAMCDHLS